jgi:hypothetical protein
MPLGDLPEHMRSVREGGSLDYGPVVDVGRIVDDGPPRWMSVAAYSTALCMLLGLGLVGYSSTGTIIIDANRLDSASVSEIVREEGGRVFSAKQKEDGTHEVRVLTFKRMSSFLEQLKKNKEIKKAEER